MDKMVIYVWVGTLVILLMAISFFLGKFFAQCQFIKILEDFAEENGQRKIKSVLETVFFEVCRKKSETLSGAEAFDFREKYEQVLPSIDKLDFGGIRTFFRTFLHEDNSIFDFLDRIKNLNSSLVSFTDFDLKNSARWFYEIALKREHIAEAKEQVLKEIKNGTASSCEDCGS